MSSFDAPAIHLHLSPRIAIFASPEVTASCQANGLTGLDELFKPFQDSIERVQVLSSSLTPTVYPTYPLRFTSYEALERSQSGGGGYVPYAAETVVDVISNLVDKLDADDIDGNDKQYAVLRDVLLAAGPIAEHETFNHPLCFILATSIASPDPLGGLQKLANLSASNLAYSTRPFMDASNVMRLRLVVHDVLRDGPDLLRSQQLLAQVKKTFGPHASMVVINSAPPISVEGEEITEPPLHRTYARALTDIARNDPFKRLTEVLDENVVVERQQDGSICARRGEPPALEMYARHLREEDILAIRVFLRELATQSIIPYMEGRVREWSEVWGNSRRGITGRLFGAGKKFFGSSSPRPTTGGSGYNTVRGYYPSTSPEAISRKLADFSFMLRDYSYAAKVYDSIRRDYAQDGATKLAASATEMFGVATLAELATTRGRDLGRLLPDIPSWLEQATAGYRSVRTIQMDSLRATLLFLEAWRAWSLVDRSWRWTGVSKALVRCAEDQDEVPSAILLEQAAAADLKAGKVRRHAAHLVMAAGRYERSGQRSLSGRCLESALPHYRNQSPPWIHAQDFIAYGLGRQAYTLGKSAEAVEHFARLLQRGDAAGDQAGVLDNFVLAYQQLKAKPNGRDLSELALPVPVFDVTGTEIVLPEDDRESSQAEGSGTRLVAIGQPFTVSALACNPLNTAVDLSKVTLGATRLDGEPSDAIHFSTVDISLDPLETRRIDFEATIDKEDAIRISQITYTFHQTFTTHQSLKRRGRRRFDTKQARLEPSYEVDKSLDVVGKSGLPALRVDPLSAVDVLEGEQIDLKIALENISDVDVDRIELFVDPPIPSAETKLRASKPIELSGISRRQAMETELRLHCRSDVQFEFIGHAGSASTRVRRTMLASVTPSLSLSARTVYQDLSSTIAQLEIFNHSEYEIVVDSIEGDSPFWEWTLRSMVSSRILPNQYGHCFGNLRPLDAPDSSPSVVNALRRLIANQPLDNSTSPLIDCESSRGTSRLESLRSQYPLISPEQLCHIFPLFGPEGELDITVHWHLAEDATRLGQTIIHGFQPGIRQSFLDDLAAGPGGRNMFEQTTRNRAALVKSIMEGPLGVEEIPLRLRWTDSADGRALELQNLSFRYPLRYALELEDGEDIIVLGARSLTGQLLPRSSEVLDIPLAAIEPATVQAFTTWRLAVTVGTSPESDWVGRVCFSIDGRDETHRRAITLDGVGA